MVVALDGETLEAALVERAGAGGVAVGVPALGVGDGEKPHELAEVAVGFGPEDHVPVVGHQAVGEDADGEDFEGTFDHPFHGEIVGVIVEDG